MKERIKSIIGGIIVVGAILLSVYKMRKTQASTKSSKIFPLKMDIINKKVIFGSIQPKKEVKLKPRISGILERLYIKVGKRVKRGAPIARISPILPPDRISEAKTRLEIALIKANAANISFEREKSLIKKKIISKQEFEKSENDWKIAQENLDSAKNNLDLLEKGYIPGRNKAANIVTSTISGVILDLPFEEGNSVMERSLTNEGSDIAIIADMSQMIFRGDLDESDVSILKEGMVFTVKVNAIEGKEFSTKLTKVSPKGKEKDGLTKFSVEGNLSYKEFKEINLRAGYTAIAEVIIAEAKDVLAINEKYLTSEKDKHYVYILSKNKKIKKDVEIGISDGIFIEIKKGLTEKDQLFVEDDKD